MQPGLIVNADDLGIDDPTTRGIVSSYERGIVSSASLMVTMPASIAAAKIALAAKLPVGLHVDLTQGRAISAPRPGRIADETGVFRLRASQLIRTGGKDTALIDQIRKEIKAQLTYAADLDLRLTHVDSHQHVHMNPGIFAILEEEALAFGVRHIRFSHEPIRNLFLGRSYARVLKRNNLPKWTILRAHALRIMPRLETPELFFGVLHSGSVVKRILLDFLKIVPKNKSAEICVHPGLPDRSAPTSDNPLAAFSVSAFRRLEHDALVDQETAALVRERGLMLRSYDGKLK